MKVRKCVLSAICALNEFVDLISGIMFIEPKMSLIVCLKAVDGIILTAHGLIRAGLRRDSRRLRSAMSLTHCTKCGHLMSTTAPRCPGCGMPPYRRGLVASPAIPHRHNSHLTALGANHYIVIALVAVTMIALVAWWAFYIRESARNAGASGAAEPGHAPHVVVEPHSNVEIAREYWCEKAAQGFATVVGVTEILARITAVDCAGNTRSSRLRNGCLTRGCRGTN